MAEAIVRAKAVRWISDEFPGWIEVVLVDADGREHLIVEKVPVVTDREVTSSSAFPAELWLRARVGHVDGARVHVTLAHSVETTEGRSTLQVRTSDVEWI